MVTGKITIQAKHKPERKEPVTQEVWGKIMVQ